MIFPLWPSPPEVSRCCISYGNLWFGDSDPLFPASESAIFPRDTYNFGTLALSSRRLKVLCFLRKSMILGLFPSLSLSSRSLKVLHFQGKSLIVGHKPFVPQRAEREGPPKQNSRGVPRKSSSWHLPVEIKINSGEFSSWNWDDIFGEINSWEFFSWMACFWPWLQKLPVRGTNGRGRGTDGPVRGKDPPSKGNRRLSKRL